MTVWRRWCTGPTSPLLLSAKPVSRAETPSPSSDQVGDVPVVATDSAFRKLHVFSPLLVTISAHLHALSMQTLENRKMKENETETVCCRLYSLHMMFQIFLFFFLLAALFDLKRTGVVANACTVLWTIAFKTGHSNRAYSSIVIHFAQIFFFLFFLAVL